MPMGGYSCRILSSQSEFLNDADLGALMLVYIILLLPSALYILDINLYNIGPGKSKRACKTQQVW